MDGDRGEHQNFFFQISSYTVTMPSQNVNAGTVAPIVNPESIPVDLDLEEDLEEIQCEAAAEQARIEEAAQAKLAAARERIERKRKAKEEEARKAEEEEARNVADAWKAEEDRVAKEKASEESQRRQLKMSCHRSCFSLVGTDIACRC